MAAAAPSAPSSPPRSSVAISFGSPAGESGVTRLDLNDVLVRHPQAAFLMRISGDSMREAGVQDGDLALVDRALSAAHGQVVIAILDDEFVCRRLHRRGGDVRLCSADAACPDWVPGEGEELQIWGVVTHVIRPLAASSAE
jgi:DNA polymerase V